MNSNGLLLYDLGINHVLAELDEACLDLSQFLNEEFLHVSYVFLLLLYLLVYPTHLCIQLFFLSGNQLSHLMLHQCSEVPGYISLHAVIPSAQRGIRLSG